MFLSIWRALLASVCAYTLTGVSYHVPVPLTTSSFQFVRDFHWTLTLCSDRLVTPPIFSWCVGLPRASWRDFDRPMASLHIQDVRVFA
jgi:hypothetical protein